MSREHASGYIRRLCNGHGEELFVAPPDFIGENVAQGRYKLYCTRCNCKGFFCCYVYQTECGISVSSFIGKVYYSPTSYGTFTVKYACYCQLSVCQ